MTVATATDLDCQEADEALATDGVKNGSTPTLWGLSPTELHDRFWASRGIQVVRRGQPSQVVDGVELYMLTNPRTLTIFAPSLLVERLYWSAASILTIRIHDQRQRAYVERILIDKVGRFLRFNREYASFNTQLARVTLTTDRVIADAWQAARSDRAAMKMLRTIVTSGSRIVDRTHGSFFDSASVAEQTNFTIHLLQRWARPDSTISRCSEAADGVWLDSTSTVNDRALLDGPVWVGAGAMLTEERPVLGPAVIWDDPKCRPVVDDVRWHELEPTQTKYRAAVQRARGLSRWRRKAKRAFDILFAVAALILVLPIFPIVILAIWIEDGRPFFFTHQRETIGGREFACIKFRSMRKNAEEIKRELATKNLADGPQFFMAEDPRMTHVGRFLRRSNIDELPQFINVLLGDMSVVGPRPSPRRENQFSPSWREARLSVRAGITGLWQLMRTRRPGMDFQEWIRYDLEYVERMSLRFDVSIIVQTVVQILRGKV